MKKIIPILLISALVLATPVFAADTTTTPAPTEDTRTKEEIREELKEKYHLVWFGDVRNDVTGNWRLAEYAASEPFENFALDYYKAYVENDKEVHAVINMTVDVTYSLTASSVDMGYLFVRALDYVEGEEHDAKTLFTGDELGKFEIDTKTGKIEKIVPDETESEVTPTGKFDAYISVLEPLLQEQYDKNYKISEDGDTLSVSFWIDGLVDEFVLASQGNSAALTDCVGLKESMKQTSGTLLTSLKNIYPKGHLIFSILNDQNTDNVLLMYYDGELQYDCLA